MAPVIAHVEVGGAYGGSLRALELYLRACDPGRLQHDLLFYYPTPGMERLRPLVRRLQVLLPAAPGERRRRRLPRPRLPGEDALQLALRLPLCRRLERALRASGCAAVHCNNSFTYQAPTVVAAHRARLPLAAHVRNPLRGTACERWLARHTQLLLTLHGLQSEQLRGWKTGVEIALCPDGVALPAATAAETARLRRQWLPEGGVLVGALGRLEPQKGFDELLAAAARLLPQHPRVRMVICGEGPERAALERSLAARGLGGRVTLAGFVPDRASLLAALDLLVCSSRWEGLPLAVLEGLLAGVPVVATANALRGDTRLHAFLAAPPAAPGADALAASLAEALADPGRAERATAAGRAWVSAEFSPAAAAERLDAGLDRLVCRSPQGHSFYEAAYTQPAWRRPAAPATGAEAAAAAAAPPGARFTKMWYRAALETILPRLPIAGRRVLEIGAGYGYLAEYLAQAGAQYTGLDLAFSALLQFPRGLARCAPVQGDACRLPFADGSFDLVLCMEVFEHVTEGRALLDEIQRVSAPGALLLLSTPSYCNFFLPVKLLADAGWAGARRLINRQPVDHTQFAFRLRRLLAGYGDVLEQRAVRLHPPLWERLDGFWRGPERGSARAGLGSPGPGPALHSPSSAGAALRASQPSRGRGPRQSMLRWCIGRGGTRLNDWVFAFERRWGARPPWRHLGLHTCFLVQLRHREARPGPILYMARPELLPGARTARASRRQAQRAGGAR